MKKVLTFFSTEIPLVANLVYLNLAVIGQKTPYTS
jgi:hypothetical protein